MYSIWTLRISNPLWDNKMSPLTSWNGSFYGGYWPQTSQRCICNKNFDIENARLRKYREKLTCYYFSLSWREGKTNEIADALSRAPVFPAPEAESEDFVDVCNAISSLKLNNSDSDHILARMIKAAKADTYYQLTLQALGTVLADWDETLTQEERCFLYFHNFSKNFWNKWYLIWKP